MRVRDYAWPLIGVTAVIVSTWLLYQEIRNLSVEDIVDSLNAIPWHRWLLAATSTVVAYIALAGYDALALTHLGKRISWPFVTLCSFTAYALAHNIDLAGAHRNAHLGRIDTSRLAALLFLPDAARR